MQLLHKGPVVAVEVAAIRDFIHQLLEDIEAIAVKTICRDIRLLNLARIKADACVLGQIVYAYIMLLYFGLCVCYLKGWKRRI